MPDFFSQAGQLDPPATIGRFSVISRLGEGAHGCVLLAHDAAMDRRVAIKVPRLAGEDPSMNQRLVRESKAAARLRHPNLVAVYESGEAAGQPYVVSEFVDGKSLARLLAGLDNQTLARAESGQPKSPSPGLSRRKIAQWIRELADALAYAHDEGIIHRDVKPDNILIDAAQRPRLLDFGLSLRLDDESVLTTDGSLLGSPAYMSPEQAAGDRKQIGPCSDQYNLGVVFYELLTGRVPFSGPPHIVIQRIMGEPPPPPHSVNPGVPRDLNVICLKTLAKNPAARYPSCRELADDLGRWLDGRPIAARHFPIWERAARWTRQSPLVASLLLLAAVLLLAITAGSMRLLTRLQSDQARVTNALRATQAEVQREQMHLQTISRQEAESRKQLELADRRAQDARSLELATAESLKKLEAENLHRLELEQKLTSEREQLSAARETLTAFEKSRQAAIAALDSLEPAPRYREIIKIADAAVRSGEYGAARKLLVLCPDSERNWEWQYLMGRTKASVVSVLDIPLRRPHGEIKFSNDGQRLMVFAANRAGKVELQTFEVTETGAEIPVGNASTKQIGDQWKHARIKSLAINAEQTRAIVLPDGSPAVEMDLKTGRCTVRKFKLNKDGLLRVGYAPNGALNLVALQVNKHVQREKWVGGVFNSATEKLRFLTEHQPRNISPDGTLLATQHHNHWCVTTLATGETRPIGAQGQINSSVPPNRGLCRFSANNRWLFMRNSDFHQESTMLIGNLEQGEIALLSERAFPVDIAPNDDRIATLSGIWDVATQELNLPLQELANFADMGQTHGRYPINNSSVHLTTDIQWSPDGRRIAVSSRTAARIYFAPEDAESFPDLPDAPLKPTVRPTNAPAKK